MTADERPLRVLLFQPSSVFGGAERSALNVIRYLEPDRVRIVLVASSDVLGGTGGCEFTSTASLGMAEGFVGMRRAWQDARRLTRFAREQGCDVMIGFLHYGAIIAALCRVTGRGRLRTIASPRTPSRHAVRQLVGSRGIQVRKWHLLIHFFMRAAHRIVVASEGLKGEAVHSYGARPSAVTVVPNGVDGELVRAALAAAPERPGSGGFRVVSVGRLVGEKDVATLIRAFALARDRMPDPELWIVGDGPQTEALQALASELGVEGQVRFLGFHKRPFGLVKSCDVFVHTALYEGFGNVILEAMACGVATIATDCDFGPREIITPGEDGLLARPSDPEDLADKLVLLAGDRELRERMATAGQRTVQRFSAERMASGYQQVFLDLAGVSGSGRGSP